MILLQPFGLLALLGIPAVLTLFFLRPKYQPRQLSSTYIWRLSGNYLKKYSRSRKMLKYLTLLLQLLLIALAALMLSQPRMLSGGAWSEYIAILDTSASMRTENEGGVSRFEEARQRILADMKKTGLNGHISVITTASSANLLMERCPSVSEAQRILRGAVCGYGEADVDSALRAAQELLDAYPQAQVFFYTDQDCPLAENLTVVNVAAGREEWNAAVMDLQARFSGGAAELTHRAVSYGRDAVLTLGLYVNGRLLAAQMVDCQRDEPVEVAWSIPAGTSLGYARVLVDAADGLREDNEICLFRQPPETLNIQLVSQDPFYWELGLSAFPQQTLTTVKTLEAAQDAGFDLYLYDGCCPLTLPKDGAVFLLNPDALPPAWGLEAGETIRGAYLSQPKKMADSANRALLSGVTASKIAVQKLLEITPRGGITPVLLCGEMPALLAGRQENGAFCAVLAFDIHDSNLPMLPDFVALLNNLLSFVMPDMLEKYDFQVGETVAAKAVPFCEEMLLQAPDGMTRPLERNQDTARFSVSRPGVYTLLEERAVGSRKYCRFFVGLPEKESDIRAGEEDRWLYLSPGGTGEPAPDAAQDAFDPTPFLALLALGLLALECVVYNRAYL